MTNPKGLNAGLSLSSFSEALAKILGNLGFLLLLLVQNPWTCPAVLLNREEDEEVEQDEEAWKFRRVGGGGDPRKKAI